MQKSVPGWIVAIIGAMYRFVAGAFGVSLPRPWRTALCGPFWAALLGCTVGLPIVLFAWTIRLIFGKGRAGRMWGTLDDWAHSSIGKFLGKVFAVLAIIAVIGYFIYTYGWQSFGLVILAIVVVVGIIFGLVLGALGLDNKFKEWKLNRPPKPQKEQKEKKGPNPALAWLWASIKKVFVVLTWIPKMLLLGLWQALVFFGLMIFATYKKFCPIVEFA